MALIRQRKLTKQQIRRIDKQQLASQDSIDDSLMDGVVMAHYGKQLEVQVTSLPAVIPVQPEIAPDDPEPFWQELALGDIWRCHVRTNLPMLAAGDQVRWSADPNTGFGRIESVKPRTSLVSRPDRYHKLKPVAANVDILAIVFAPLPAAAPTPVAWRPLAQRPAVSVAAWPPDTVWPALRRQRVEPRPAAQRPAVAPASPCGRPRPWPAPQLPVGPALLALV